MLDIFLTADALQCSALHTSCKVEALDSPVSVPSASLARR